MLLMIDSTLVLQLVTNRRHMTDEEVLSESVALISRMSVSDDEAKIIVAVEGPCHTDVLERRRRASYARAVTRTEGAWDVDKTMPGTEFQSRFVRVINDMGWTVVDGGGSILSSISRAMTAAEAEAGVIVHLFARERDADALAWVNRLRLVCTHGHLRQYQSSSLISIDAGADAVVLDILTGGGSSGGSRTGVLVQDLPGLPRMPGSFAEAALHRAYREWGGCLTTPDNRLDRTSFAELLTCYTEVSKGENDDSCALSCWSGADWRRRYTDTSFPHGSDHVCQHYLDAIDRELMYLSGGRVTPDNGAYVHGCAPSAMDLANSVHHHVIRSQDSHVDVANWSSEMQLAAMLPRSAGGSSALHTCLDLGCVHMFPVSYQLWWGVYPVIPALNTGLMERGLTTP